MRNVAFPYRIDATGVTAGVDRDRHIRDLIEQVLFTSPQERVNRPTFGSGLMNLIFAPNSNEVAAATQFLVQGALQQTLAELVSVEMVSAVSEAGMITVTVQYSIKPSGERTTAAFRREL